MAHFFALVFPPAHAPLKTRLQIICQRSNLEMAQMCTDIDMAKEHPLTGNMQMLTISLWRLRNNMGQTWVVTVSEGVFPVATAVPKPALEKKGLQGLFFKWQQ